MTITVDEMTREILDMLSEQTGMSRSMLIRRAMIRYGKEVDGPLLQRLQAKAAQRKAAAKKAKGKK